MRPTPRALSRTLAALTALTALASGRHADAYTRTGGTWRTLPVTWFWNPATVPSSLMGADNARVALEAGFSTWASAPCTSFRATNGGTTAVVRGSTRDRVNTFAWITGSWPAELGAVNSVVGVTLPVRSGAANIDADIMFNNVGFTWSTTGARGTVDTQSIAVHEEGHFLGLGHTTVPRESIMYPSYPGRPSRVMSSDDIAGVCALYPGTGAPFDAGTPPADPCAATTSCGECTPLATCGWCGSTRRCMTGNASGATVGTCPGAWSPYPMNCTSTVTPDAGAEPGTTQFGGACRGSADCSTGGPCVSVSGGQPFCSQSCEDDCSCPRGYVCTESRSGISLCTPGTNRCPPDAGTAPAADVPAVDAGTGTDAPPVDAGSTVADAGSDVPTAAVVEESGGCGCRATSSGRQVPGGLLALLALLAVRRRRDQQGA